MDPFFLSLVQPSPFSSRGQRCRHYPVDRRDRDMALMHRDMNRLMDEVFHLGSASSAGALQEAGGDTNFLQSHVFDSTSAQTITEKDGQKLMNFHFDVSGFQPEEIEIKTANEGKQLLVKASHSSEKDGHSLKREYHRMMTVPQNVKAQDFKSVLSPDGMLSITAPMQTPPAEEKKAVEGRKKDVDMAITHE